MSQSPSENPEGEEEQEVIPPYGSWTAEPGEEPTSAFSLSPDDGQPTTVFPPQAPGTPPTHALPVGEQFAGTQPTEQSEPAPEAQPPHPAYPAPQENRAHSQAYAQQPYAPYPPDPPAHSHQVTAYPAGVGGGYPHGQEQPGGRGAGGSAGGGKGFFSQFWPAVALLGLLFMLLVALVVLLPAFRGVDHAPAPGPSPDEEEAGAPGGDEPADEGLPEEETAEDEGAGEEAEPGAEQEEPA